MTTIDSTVLVLYTGGTIGMLVGRHGYVPEPLFLTEVLRGQTRFHDPLLASLYSHSSSVEGFREWKSHSNSGVSTPLAAAHPPPSSSSSSSSAAGPHSTLAVRSSRPIGQLTGKAAEKNMSAFENGSNTVQVRALARAMLDQPMCVQIAEDVYEAQLPCLVTPGNDGKRIRYAILEWDPLLDSSNMGTDDWIRIATEIELNYHNFDGFVILHGTDTMAYTSSALSFLLEDLGKTVIVTGAQIPLSKLRNDAVDNLLGALIIAGSYIIPECSLFFNHTLYRGNRVSKASSDDLDAFDSPNFSPLVNVGIDIEVNWDDVLRQRSLRRFKAHKSMSHNVATLRLFPGISSGIVRAFLAPPIQGLVLETFGAGNAPQREDLMREFKAACDRGVVIVAISQCLKGSVSDSYATGRALLQTGVIAGADMTPECALTKLTYLLSKSELSIMDVRNLMGTPLRGELTRSEGAQFAHPTMDQDLQLVQDLLGQIMRLSSQGPTRLSSSGGSASSTEAHGPEHALNTTRAVAAAWSWTASEATSASASLLPYLIHLAVSRNDEQSLEAYLGTGAHRIAVPGGLINCLEPTSSRAPIHVAALNGSLGCTKVLLAYGALVHLRDSLGHTALYYAARQGHADIVNILQQAGANLGGADLDRGYAALEASNAARRGDVSALAIWKQLGIALESVDKEDSSGKENTGEL